MLRWLKENWGSLLLSLLLALTIWIVAVQQQDPVTRQEFPDLLPVTIQELPADLVIAGDYTQGARVTLRASDTTWTLLEDSNVTLQADLSNLSPGTHDIPLQLLLADDFQATAIQIQPVSISITLEEKRERNIPVHLVLEGQLPVGFEADDPIVEPGSITVSGPASLVDQVSEITATLDLSDKREQFEIKIPISLLDSRGQPVQTLQITPEEVLVNVHVTQKPDFKEIAIIVRDEGAPQRLYFVSNISVTPLSVTLQGSPDVLNAMPGFVETRPVDLTGHSENFMLPVNLILPEGVVVADETPIIVTVEIEALTGSVARQLTSELVGLDGSLRATLSTRTVDVILSGPLAALEVLTDEDVRVVLDLTDLTEGTHQIEPRVIILVEGLISQTVLPATIEVQIERMLVTPTPAPTATLSATAAPAPTSTP